MTTTLKHTTSETKRRPKLKNKMTFVAQEAILTHLDTNTTLIDLELFIKVIINFFVL